MRKIYQYSDTPEHYLFECPGCGYSHVFDARWKFNGNFEKPTFTPSLLCNQHATADDIARGIHRCHTFVTDGKIQFLSDCSHHLAGQTVELSDVEGRGA